ncbi:FAD-dependent oxidoreductase [Aristophania vespae]|uniref:FAD-dependent oxidoreductase n=1 Tax=Aristophania vespae TaxID=2697033 RepID=A0A6P1N9Z1_9PROT|nr:FAD-dependent oxidoreductase [Aristophania vespae]QHI95236.1 FAD-dependent oxidoreductase [Aristophania vespae]
MSAKRRVIILGGGIGGIEAAIALSRKAGVSLTLVDPNAVHVWKPALHEFAAGTLNFEENVFSFEKLSKKFKFNFIQGAPSSIDRQAKSVKLSDGQTLEYDYLIVSIGGVQMILAHQGQKRIASF